MYDWLAPLYDLGVWSLALFFGGEERFREKVINEATPFLKGGSRVLEIFAGTATLSLIAAQRGAKVTALDLSKGMLGVAKEKSKKTGREISLVRGDAASLPFIDNAFGCAIVSMGLHEIPKENIPPILADAYRVLKKGGRLVIFDFYRAEGLARFAQKLFFMFVEGETASEWVMIDLQKLLWKAGFRNFKRQFFLSRSFQILTVEKA